jgi:hypothetical protein
MSQSIGYAFREEIERAKQALSRGDYEAATHHFERAHILGQRHLWRHAATHCWMLRIAFRRRDWRELFGQVTRLIATVPAYMLGWVPVGNTGGANVSPIKPMPVPPDLAPHFVGYSVWRGVGLRLALVLALALALALVLAAASSS